MDIPSKYSKDNPELEPEPPKRQPPVRPVTHPASTFPTLTPYSQYTKPQATQEPLTFVVIFSGGEQCEKDYFIVIEHNRALFPRLKYEFHSEPDLKTGGEPKLFEFAYQKIEEYKSSLDNNHYKDSYYIVSDVDEFYPFLVNHMPICKQKGVTLIVSNPCFEVWLYYSKYSDKFTGFTFPKEFNKRSQCIKKYYKSKNPSHTKGCIFNIANNIDNARNNYTEDAQGLPEMFSTQMWQLAEEIRPLIQDGLKLLAARTLTARH